MLRERICEGDEMSEKRIWIDNRFAYRTPRAGKSYMITTGQVKCSKQLEFQVI